VAGFISESWPGSNRNGGRHQIGIPGRIASEFAPDPGCEKLLITAALTEAVRYAISSPAEAIGESYARRRVFYVG
jgi:hypothetical protein